MVVQHSIHGEINAKNISENMEGRNNLVDLTIDVIILK
jgi:hypothetical protein